MRYLQKGGRALGPDVLKNLKNNGLLKAGTPDIIDIVDNVKRQGNVINFDKNYQPGDRERNVVNALNDYDKTGALIGVDRNKHQKLANLAYQAIGDVSDFGSRVGDVAYGLLDTVTNRSGQSLIAPTNMAGYDYKKDIEPNGRYGQLRDNMLKLGMSDSASMMDYSSAKSAYALMNDIKNKNPKASDEELLSIYKKRVGSSSEHKNYDKNVNGVWYDNDEDSSGDTTMGNVSGFISNKLAPATKGLIGNKIAEFRDSKLWNVLSNPWVSPTAAKMMISDLAGTSAPITNDSFQDNDKRVLDKLMYDNINKNKSYVEYKDYVSSGDVDYQDYVKRNGINTKTRKETVGNMITNSGAMAKTIGSGNIVKNDDGTYSLVDQYNFNDGGLETNYMGKNLYGMIREYATDFGSREGNGPMVNYKFNMEDYKRDNDIKDTPKPFTPDSKKNVTKSKKR